MCEGRRGHLWPLGYLTHLLAGSLIPLGAWLTMPHAVSPHGFLVTHSWAGCKRLIQHGLDRWLQGWAT